jgi:hypothetical protein
MVISVGSLAEVAACFSGYLGWGFSDSGERPLVLLEEAEKALEMEAVMSFGIDVAFVRELGACIELRAMYEDRTARVERRASLRRFWRAIGLKRKGIEVIGGGSDE